MDEMNQIAVIGLGGVGGFIGGLLAEKYPQTQLVVRGARGEKIRQDGFYLHSETNGEIYVQPQHVVPSADQLEDRTVIFICVKNYGLQDVCERLKTVLKPETILIPVMNGVFAAEHLKRCFPSNVVLSSVIYTVSALNADGSVTQRYADTHVDLGSAESDRRHADALQTVYGLMRGANIDVRLPEDIEAAVWYKYILNCAYNVETAAYDEVIGQLREDPVKKAEYGVLIHEAFTVAHAKGIAVDDRREAVYRMQFETFDYDATSSLHRDVRAGKQSEYDVFSAYLIREAHRLGVSVPITEKMDGMLRERLARTNTADTK